MSDRIDDDREWVSALADGQLQGEALARGLEALAQDPAAFEAWQAYHLVGDVLRAPELAAATAPDVFLAGVRHRLAGSRVEEVPSPLPAGAPADAPASPVPVPSEAANDRHFRWKRLATAASLAMAVAVGGFALDAWWSPAASTVARDEAGRAWRDARLDDLLSAHRHLGGAATALPAPAGFVHPASFERPAAARP